MSHVGTSGPQTFVQDPEHTRLVCDVLSDVACEGKYQKKKSYQVLRTLNAEELYALYTVLCEKGNHAFREAFGPVYHQKRGESDGPLFEDKGGDFGKA